MDFCPGLYRGVGGGGYFLGGSFWQELGENFAFQSGLSLTMYTAKNNTQRMSL